MQRSARFDTARFTIVIQTISRLRMQKTATRLTILSGVRSFEASALRTSPDESFSLDPAHQPGNRAARHRPPSDPLKCVPGSWCGFVGRHRTVR